MVRNLSHIANQAFNRPIALEPGYARVFYSVLASEMGIGSLIDGATGETLDAQKMEQEAAYYRSNAQSKVDEDRGRYYQLVDGIAIVPVSGTLAHKYGSIRPYSGITGYDGIISRISFAMQDPAVRGVMIDFDTPGGQVAGCFDATDIIARFRNEKPIWSLGYDMHCSAGQALSSACSRRLITQTGVAGSVGVVMVHANMKELMEKQGTEITLIHSGAHKVEGNPYEALPDDVRSKLQLELDGTRELFARKVADNIGLDIQAVLDTEAATYTGQEAVDIGFADELVNGADAVGLMIEHLDAQNTTIVDMGATMTATNTAASATTDAANTNTASAANSGNEGAQPTASTVDATTVATNERTRVLGIIGCDEAKGREDMANKLAAMPNMSVDDAKGLLATAPKATGSDAASEALAALSDEHGQSLSTADASQSDDTDEDAQVNSLLTAFGHERK